MSIKPCTRCGSCCSQMPCSIAYALFGDVRPCPALEMAGAVGTCGLVAHASAYIDIGGPDHSDAREDAVSRLMQHYLGIGYGCCQSPTTNHIGKAMKKAFVKKRQMEAAR